MRRLILLITFLISTGFILGCGSDDCCTGPDCPAVQEIVLDLPFSGSADDESKYENQVTAVGATLTADRFGNVASAYSFDGTDDVIYVDHDQSLEFGLGDLSICCWVRLDNYPDDDCRVVGKMSGHNRATTHGDSFGYGITVEKTGIVRGIIQESGTGEKVEWAVPLETDRWYFLGLVRGEGTLRLYVDGEIKDTIPSSKLPDNRASLEIGACKTIIHDDRWFPGSLDDILIMNRAMTGEEITGKFSEGGWE